MPPATNSIDTTEKAGEIIELIPIAAATILYMGTIGAINAAGNAVAAADAAGLRAVGRIEPALDGVSGDSDNSQGNAGDLSVNIKRSVFILDNSDGDALTAADLLNFCYVEDNQTVNKSGGAHKIPAGRFLGFPDGDTTRAIVDFKQRPVTESALP